MRKCPSILKMSDLEIQLGPEAYEKMHLKVSEGQKKGQAFFNVLSNTEQEKLCWSKVDPFNQDDWNSVLIALEYLMESED